MKLRNFTYMNIYCAYLITNVELSAPGGGTSRGQVGQDDGGQHRAPAGLHDHDAQDLALGLRNHDLQQRFGKLEWEASTTYIWLPRTQVRRTNPLPSPMHVCSHRIYVKGYPRPQQDPGCRPLV